MSAAWPVQLTVSAFNRLGQYASSPGYMAYCHAELVVFFPHGRGGQYSLSPRDDFVVRLVKPTQISCTWSWTATHPSTNRARRRATSLYVTNAISSTPNRHQIVLDLLHCTLFYRHAVTQTTDRRHSIHALWWRHNFIVSTLWVKKKIPLYVCL